MITPERAAEILRLYSRRAMEAGHHRAPDRGASHHRAPRAGRGRASAGVALGAALDGRSLCAADPHDAGEVSDSARLAAVHDGRSRGYGGGPDHFRHIVSLHRPRPAAEAYLRLRTLPGEQAQVDWGYFGKLGIGRAERTLWGFVMVLSYSRHIFLRFFFGNAMANFLRGHVGAFEVFGGVPRVLLYDNLKSAVLERVGQAIHFNPTLLELAAHYRFEPRPVAVARGNEKGRVERAIRYIRDSFFAAREFADLADLNAQATAWCEQVAAERLCPEDRSRRVHEVLPTNASGCWRCPTIHSPVMSANRSMSGAPPTCAST